MDKETKLKLISNAYIFKKVDDKREEIIIINDLLPKEFYEAIKNIQFRLNEITGTFELDYEIMMKACDFVCEFDLKKLEDDRGEINDSAYEDTFSNIYIENRLGYLNFKNQDEISQIVKANECDIQEACAYWFDDQVRTAVDMIIDYILE